MVKLYLCHETDPHVWGEIQLAGLTLLTCHELDQYRGLNPKEEDCQDKWEAAMDDPEKYVTLLVGQSNDKEQQADADEDNWHDNSDWERTTQNYFIAYHEVKAHVQWLASMPAKAEAYEWFQVGKCACFVCVLFTCHSHTSLLGMVQPAGGRGKCPGVSIGDWSVWGNRACSSRGGQGEGVVNQERPCLMFGCSCKGWIRSIKIRYSVIEFKK